MDRQTELVELQHIGYRELFYFVAVAEELHFARAALRIGINQSPLSKTITAMEHDLGARLFVRTRKSTQMTAFGEALLPEAKRILEHAARVRRNLAAAAQGHQGRLHIGVCEEVALPWVAKLLSLSRGEDPEVAFTIAQRSLTAQLDDLRSEVVDVGLASSLCDAPAGSDPNIEAISLWSEPLVLCVRPDSVLASATIVPTLESETGPYVVLGGQITERDPIRRLVHGGLEEEVVVEFTESVPMLLLMVAAGHGAGLLSASLAATVARPDVVFRPLGLKRARVTTYLLARSAGRSAGVDRFIARTRGMAVQR